MRFFRKFVILSALLLSLTTIGCDRHNDSSIVSGSMSDDATDFLDNDYAEDTNDAVPAKYVYFPFSESSVGGILNDNPIDKLYFEECKNVVTTLDATNLYDKYSEIWQNELDAVVDKIETNLSDEKLEEFQTSQEAWELFYSTDPDIAVDMYMSRMGYGTIIHYIYGDKALSMKRYRTLELAEYCYLLTGEFEFQFNQ